MLKKRLKLKWKTFLKGGDKTYASESLKPGLDITDRQNYYAVTLFKWILVHQSKIYFLSFFQLYQYKFYFLIKYLYFSWINRRF